MKKGKFFIGQEWIELTEQKGWIHSLPKRNTSIRGVARTAGGCWITILYSFIRHKVLVDGHALARFSVHAFNKAWKRKPIVHATVAESSMNASSQLSFGHSCITKGWARYPLQAPVKARNRGLLCRSACPVEVTFRRRWKKCPRALPHRFITKRKVCGWPIHDSAKG